MHENPSPELRLDVPGGRVTAVYQVEKLGFSPNDVRHIVLTHLDFDHAGGIDDFSEATLHRMSEEKDAAFHRKGLIAHGRYRPMQYSDHSLWRTYDCHAGQVGGLSDDGYFFGDCDTVRT